MAGLIGGDMSGVMTGAIIAIIFMIVIFIVFIYFKARDLIAQKKAAESFRKSTGKEGMPRGGNLKLGTKTHNYEPVCEGGEEFLSSGLYPKSRNGQASVEGPIKDVKGTHKIQKELR